jgi:hypothetical protein
LFALVSATPTARAANEKQIKQMIERGVGYLKKLQTESGAWPFPESGMTALAGLTLLECGVPAGDPSVQGAAKYVRQSAVGEEHTYSLALAILFLDRLGDDFDVTLIEAMAVRLLAGQQADGGWRYKSGSQLVAGQSARLVGGAREGGSGERRAPGATERRKIDDVSKAARGEIEAVVKGQPAQGAAPPAGGAGLPMPASDNSNTQFAILGLWTARRYGVPIDDALAKVEARFRDSQILDGGWGYTAGELKDPNGNPIRVAAGSSPTMTCAGLLGLAMYHADAGDRNAAGGDRAKRPGPAKDVTKDPSIARALRALGTTLVAPPAFNVPGARPGGAGGGRPGAQPAGAGQAPGVNLPPRLVGGPNRGGAAPPPQRAYPVQNARLYYFLWSVERVAVAYGLDKIGNKDWYKYGADILLLNQEADGSWQGAYGSFGADTCFALLFLRKADLAKDLSTSLRGKIKDSSELRAGPLKDRESIKPIRSPFENPPDSERGSSEKPVGTANKPTTVAPKTGNPDVDKLTSELVEDSVGRWKPTLQRLRDGKGPEYTQALAHAIPQLEGYQKNEARQALAERLSNFKRNTRLGYMEDEDAELRRAAALACAMKEDTATVGKLIELLADRERTVERAAYVALKELTKQDFGPAADADAAAKAEAIKNWKAWKEKQTK